MFLSVLVRVVLYISGYREKRILWSYTEIMSIVSSAKLQKKERIWVLDEILRNLVFICFAFRKYN